MDTALNNLKELVTAAYSCCHGTLSHPVTLLSLLVTLLVLIYWNGTRRYCWLFSRTSLPGATPLPYMGNFLDVRRYGGVHNLQLEYIRRYGKIFTWSLGREPSIVVADPDILKHILVKEFPKFRNRYRENIKVPLPLSESLFNSKDEKWKRIRSTLTPAFSGLKMKQMVPLIEEAADTLVSKLQTVAETGGCVDMLGWFSQLTLDIILSTAFGLQSDVQTNPNANLTKKAKLLVSQGILVRLLYSLPLGSLILNLFFLFTNRFAPFLELGYRIIRCRREQATKGIVGRKDLLHMMLMGNKRPGTDEARKLSDNEIVAQCVVFLLAGHETSSNTLAFTAYQLALNPWIQERLRLEIEIALQTNSQSPLFDVIHDIEYLDCVICEALRLHPPGYIFRRQCTEACTINGVHFPEGASVTIPVYALHRDPHVWPDVDKFDPERFRGQTRDSRHPYQYLPFGAGPRNCIGTRLALLEVKLTLVKILRKFKFVRSPETQVPLVLQAGGTLTARNGIHLRVQTVK